LLGGIETGSLQYQNRNAENTYIIIRDAPYTITLAFLVSASPTFAFGYVFGFAFTASSPALGAFTLAYVFTASTRPFPLPLG